MARAVAALFLVAVALAGCATAGPVADRPIVIAHRGASGERPEHTLAAYELAIAQGADFIEPDLVATKDGVLVARHENEISGTTDVASRPEFAGRKTVKTIDGERVEGWFTEDFTLAELKRLRARERLPELRAGNVAYDGRYEVPTFAEVLEMAREKGVGVYPETKHPSYFRSIGLPLEEPLVAELKRVGWKGADAPVFIQSFEVDNLKRLNGMTGVRLVQLMAADGGPADGGSYAAMATPEGLRAVAEYADGIGPEKAMVIPRDRLGRLRQPTGLVRDAHAAGLEVHPWTFRAENVFLPLGLRRGLDPRAHGRLAEEMARFLEAGVDGLFTDHPAVGVAATRVTKQ